MNKKILLIIFLGVFLIGIMPKISPVGQISYCCEKNVDGFWCLNEEDPARCDATGDLHSPVPTSCSSTYYCQLGCCFNSQEGTCMPNTPQRVCDAKGGAWDSQANCDIPQCSLGCCIIGNQAGFITQTRCKRLSYLYGIENQFRTDVTNDLECFALGGAKDVGACVFERDYEKTCEMKTREECTALQNTEGETVTFHKDFLCSAETLGTNCGPTKKTTCVEGRDEVYYLDSCGNIANIYDSTKQNDKDYWAHIYSKENSCDDENGNKGSPTCGNCDYYSGSICKTYDKNKDDNSPQNGDNICRSLDCEFEGEIYKHGETFCATNARKNELAFYPGAEFFRLVCFNNKVTIEPCAAFRQEVCVQTEVNGFKAAKCRANLWRDCIAQPSKEDCEDKELRDCIWARTGNKYENKSDVWVCLPEFPPGLEFWGGEEDTEAEKICKVAEQTCEVTFEKKGWDALTKQGEWKCIQNCECCINDPDGDGTDDHKGCTGEKWSFHEAFCEALGDCGSKVNYENLEGKNSNEELRKEIK